MPYCIRRITSREIVPTGRILPPFLSLHGRSQNIGARCFRVRFWQREYIDLHHGMGMISRDVGLFGAGQSACVVGRTPCPSDLLGSLGEREEEASTCLVAPWHTDEPICTSSQMETWLFVGRTHGSAPTSLTHLSSPARAAPVSDPRYQPAPPVQKTLLHVQLTEEEHRQVLAMSLSTAERYLRTQCKPRLHGLSTTTPGSQGKAQILGCACLLSGRRNALALSKSIGWCIAETISIGVFFTPWR